MGQNTPFRVLTNFPPEKEKIETIRILKEVPKAAAALAELKGIGKTLPYKSMLINAIVLKEAKGSSEIENIITTHDELYKALAINSSNTTLATKEVVNYRKAVFAGFDFVKRQGFLRFGDILHLQQELTGNNAGIRTMPGTVLKNDLTGATVYTPPQDKKEILDLLSGFIDYFNTPSTEISPLINLAILHHQFESIHPFYDGNGRTGRILNILYLILNGLMDIPILYLSSFIIENKKDYYRLLNQTNKNDEWEEWILYVLKAVEVTSLQTIEKITSIKDLLDKTIEKVKAESPKIYRKELVELLFEQPYSKIEFVVNQLKVERKAASRYLQELEKIGVLESQKVGREILYINKELFELLKK